MANLSDLIKNKFSNQVNIERLEKGTIWAYSPGTTYTDYCDNVRWCSPGTGVVTLEIWGAGGSGAKMCCCGFGLPGNPGAYSRSVFAVYEGDIVCGRPGRSCNNSDDLCFRGCSESTCVCWTTSNPLSCSGCMCAEGGFGGISYCSTTTSGLCCFGKNGFSVTSCTETCGIACNYRASTPRHIAQAFCGQVNCPGGFSCTMWNCCHPNRPCAMMYMVRSSPMVYSTDGITVMVPMEENTQHSNWSGQGPFQYLHGMNAASKAPTGGALETRCWNGGRNCGCYNSHGCMRFYPYGFPGLPPSPCSGVRDHATTGGQGAIRIRFEEAE